MTPAPADRPIVAGVPLAGMDLIRLGTHFAKRFAPQHLREDAAGAFVVGALQAAPRVRLDGKPVAFLIQNGIGGILNLVGRERRQRAASLDAEWGTPGDSWTLGDTLPDKRTSRPDARIAAQDVAATVRAAVASLPTRERTVAAGVLMGGRRAADVAAEAGITEQGVRARLGKTVRRLRYRLATCAP